MDPVKNPSKEQITEIISASEQQAAKWIKDLQSDDYWYWPASWVTHSKMAETLGVQDYEKGIQVDK